MDKEDKDVVHIPASSMLNELYSNRKCIQIGKVIICVSGTDKYPTPALAWGGKPATMVKMCFGRIDRPDNYYCIRVLSEEEGYISKDHIITLSDNDTVALILDDYAGLGIDIENKVPEEYGEETAKGMKIGYEYHPTNHEIWIRSTLKNPEEKRMTKWNIIL